VPPTPASSFFSLANPPLTRQRTRKRNPQPPDLPRRSIFAADEDEPDDITSTPSGAVLLGWTRTEQGVVIPQIRSLPQATPLDDTIFNSPRLPWVQTRSMSPVPSARSIPRMRQFSIESLRSDCKRELRVVNDSRPTTATGRSSKGSFDWEEQNEEVAELRDTNWDTRTPLRRANTTCETRHTCATLLKRYNSTNDSGYSSMAADAYSDSDESVDPFWWEEAAGYTEIEYPIQEIQRHTSTNITPVRTSTSLPSPGLSSTQCTTPFSTTSFCSSASTSTNLTEPQAVQYLHTERQESAYISTLLRNQSVDEWSEWRDKVTSLLMIPEETPRPETPPETNVPVSKPKSPSRRKSLFPFVKVARGLSKRKSVLW
jgi:hypothetical protein